MSLPLTGAGSPGRLRPKTAGVLAEYNFRISGAESSGTLYDRKPGGGANGTVGVGATYSAQGLTTGGSTGFAVSGVAGNLVKTILVFLKPGVGGDVFASYAGSGVQSALYCDLAAGSTNQALGQLFPRVRDLNTNAAVHVNISTASWPVSIGYTFGSPLAKLYVNGLQPLYYTDAQSDGATFAASADPIGFGNNFVSNFSSTHLYSYAVMFDGVLDDTTLKAWYSYGAGVVKALGITPGGPAALTNDLLVLSGNSLTNLINLTEITPTHTFDKLKISISGASPQVVGQLTQQAVLPLRRPQAVRNYLILWPTPNTLSAADIDTYIVPLIATARSAGIKVGLPIAISASGFDPEPMNTINAKYATLNAQVPPFVDVLITFAGRTDITAPGAFSGGAYSDGTHPTTTTYTTEIDPDITTGVNTMG